MPKFRKKPVVVEAMIFERNNWKELQEFSEYAVKNLRIEKRINGKCTSTILTSEGLMTVNEGDFVIREPFDKVRKFYPCKPDIFEKTYEEVLE